MMPDASTVNAFVQHATVTVIALGALTVVLRRVLGVFGKRPAAQPGDAATPAHMRTAELNAAT